MAEENIIIKAIVHHKDSPSSDEPDVRKFMMSPDSFSESTAFMTQLKEMFECLDSSRFKVSYEDMDGDHVLISTNEDLRIALNDLKNNTLKIKIVVESTPPLLETGNRDDARCCVDSQAESTEEEILPSDETSQEAVSGSQEGIVETPREAVAATQERPVSEGSDGSFVNLEDIQEAIPVPCDTSNDPVVAAEVDRHQILEEELDRLIVTPLALMALEAGLELAQVRDALRERLTEHDMPFDSCDDLVMHIIEAQELAAEVVDVPDPVELEEPETGKQEKVDEEDTRLCKVCFEEEIKTVFLPCHHIMCCSTCGEQIETCPLCRQPIRERMNIYFG